MISYAIVFAIGLWIGAGVGILTLALVAINKLED